MAEGDRPPTFTAAVTDKDAKMTAVWYRFIAAIARRLFGAGQVATITTADIAASAVSTTSTSLITVSDPFITAADADATYDTAERDLINQLKLNLNSLVTFHSNPTTTLVNELKTDLNALVAEVNTLATLVNELKATVNSITAALKE